MRSEILTTPDLGSADARGDVDEADLGALAFGVGEILTPPETCAPEKPPEATLPSPATWANPRLAR